jgi:P27 family predicted phage terminase small subunit
MARPRGPVERKRLHGRSATKDAAGRPLPAPVTVLPAPGAIPPPPDTLGESGRAHWSRVWNQARAWLCELDYGAAQRYCETSDLRDWMIAAVTAEGLTAVGSTGQPTAHPLIQRIEAFNAELRLLEGQLGLTPSARATIGLGEVRVQSKLDEMMARRSKQA